MTFSVYRARDGWRWRLKAKNGRIVADSGEAYTRRSACYAAVERVVQAISDGKWRYHA